MLQVPGPILFLWCCTDLACNTPVYSLYSPHSPPPPHAYVNLNVCRNGNTFLWDLSWPRTLQQLSLHGLCQWRLSCHLLLATPSRLVCLNYDLTGMTSIHHRRVTLPPCLTSTMTTPIHLTFNWKLDCKVSEQGKTFVQEKKQTGATGQVCVLQYYCKGCVV